MLKTFQERSAAVIDLWWTGLGDAFPLLLGAALVGASVVALAARTEPDGKARTRLGYLLVLIALGVGGWLAVSRASLFDDAYISFRYARNVAEGNGLVWNLGERVEGYTNFLWTLGLGLGLRLTGIPADVLGLWGCLAVLAANLLVVWRIGRVLAGPRHIPLAPLLLGAHAVFVSFGTTGMETGACSLAVNLTLWALVSRDDSRGSFLAGAAAIAATLLRPDHALFYVAGAAVVAWGARADRRRFLIHTAAYSAPFLVYVAYMVWKLGYYGDLLPNTYYAKSANLSWFAQGGVYALSFYLGAGAWLWLVAALSGVRGLNTGRGHRRFFGFAVLSFVAYNVYVAKVGGDFMFARFYISLLPLLAVGAEFCILSLLEDGRLRTAAAVGAAVAVGCVPLRTYDSIHEGSRIGIRAQWEVYSLVTWEPPGVSHRSRLYGDFFKATLVDRGIDATLAAPGIGLLGYITRLPVVDIRGLTDRTVGRQSITKRSRPGHEKLATSEYIAERGVDIIRWASAGRRLHPSAHDTVTRLNFHGVRDRTKWRIGHYDAVFWERIRTEAPEISFVNFPRWLDVWLEGEGRSRTPAELEGDMAWFRRYYFDHNADSELLARVEALLESAAPSDVP